MKKHLISILAILLVSVFILSSCELFGGNQNEYIKFLQDELEATQDKLTEVEEENDQLKNENDQLEKEISSLKNKLSTLQAEISSLKALDTENKDKIAAIEADYAAKVAELEAEYEAAIEALNAENADLALQIKDLEERIQELLNDKDYTVTFDVNGGVGEVASQTIKYKKTVTEPIFPTK